MSAGERPDIAPALQSAGEKSGRLPDATRRLSVPATVRPRARTSHACDRCRRLRIKCSGGVHCEKCTRDDACCIYSDRKREHAKRSQQEAIQQLEDLKEDKRKLLDALRKCVEDSDYRSETNRGVLELLEQMSSHPPLASSDSRSQPLGSHRGEDPTRKPPSPVTRDNLVESPSVVSIGTESLVSAEIGSPSRLRELQHPINAGGAAGMTGYVGKMASTAWLLRVVEHLTTLTMNSYPDTRAARLDMPTMDIPNLSLFMDDQDLLEIDEDYVIPYELPPWESAVILTEAYFHTVHGTFWFVQRQQLFDEIRKIFDLMAGGHLPPWNQRWHLALINMAWAIGAKWLEMTQLDQQRVDHSGGTSILEGHLTYYARARALGLDHRVQVNDPTTQTVQGLGMLGLYLIANGSIQKAWTVIGQSFRHATALGLHLRIADPAVPREETNLRAGVWHSLYRIEISLSEMTGRPKAVWASSVTAPSDFMEHAQDLSAIKELMVADSLHGTPGSDASWLALLGRFSDLAHHHRGGETLWEQPGLVSDDVGGTQFTCGLELSALSDTIGTRIYLSPADITWADLQKTTHDLSAQLAQWQATHGSRLDLESSGNTDLNARSRLELLIYYHSIAMLLFRPYVCEIKIDGESPESTARNKRYARSCVQAAIQLLNVMPDNVVAGELMQLLPWWKLIHYVAQAAAVLLLEMCLNNQHMDGETQTMTAALKKALYYLWILSPLSKSAFRTWTIVSSLVGEINRRYHPNELSGLPLHASRPRQWSQEDERLLAADVATITGGSAPD